MLDTRDRPALVRVGRGRPGLSRRALAGAAVPGQARAARRGGARRGGGELAGIRGGAPAARGDGVAALRRVLPRGALAASATRAISRFVEELSQVALARYESGSASQQDALLAEAELAELLHRERRARDRRSAARPSASTRCCTGSPSCRCRRRPRRSRFRASTAIDTAALTQRALAERPELRAARARVAAREQAVALARREYFPDFTLSGSYDRFWQEKPLQPMLGLAVNVPLQLGRRSGALDQAHAELAGARSEAQRDEDARAPRRGERRRSPARGPSPGRARARSHAAGVARSPGGLARRLRVGRRGASSS